MVDVYNRATSYERLKGRIDEWRTCEENRRHVRRYLRSVIDRRSPGRRYSDLWLLKRLFVGTRNGRAFVTKPVGALTVEDFQKIRERCDRELTSKDTYDKLTNHLRNLYEDIFSDDERKRPIIDLLFRTGRRRFFQWRSDTPINETIDRSKYYSFEEFSRILRVAHRPKDRALLALAWESTPRPNELLSLRVGDVDELTQGFRIRAHISKRRGSAPTRHLYIFTFRAEFNEFWRCHAFRDNPEAPLFYREDNTANIGRALTPPGANKMLKKLDRISGVNKNGTLYFLRHGGYTWKRLQGMNPALAGKDMGWTPGGKEDRRYLHLTEEEVMAERLRLASDQTIDPPQRPRAPQCPFCDAPNSPVDDRCLQCGGTLDVQEALAEAEQLRRFHAMMTDSLLHDVAQRGGFRLRPPAEPPASTRHP